MIQKTIALALEALDDPDLGQPGKCQYVADDGTRCVAGMILSRLGVSDDTLRGGINSDTDDDNTANLAIRHDLRDIFVEKNISEDLVQELQDQWDEAKFGREQAIQSLRLWLEQSKDAA